MSEEEMAAELKKMIEGLYRLEESGLRAADAMRRLAEAAKGDW